MRFRGRVALFICVLALAAAGCVGRQPLNVDSPVVTSKGTPTEEEVFKAILRATAVTSWVVTPQGPGWMMAERDLQGHRATVRIDYSPQRYSIALLHTTMMDRQVTRGSASPPGGGAGPAAAPTTVHRTYNRWVQELDKAIRAQLVTIGL